MKLSKLDEYKYISFDIFNTLLKRNVNKDSDVFKIVEREYNSKYHENINFYDIRKNAELIAKRKLNKNNVTFEEIYYFIDQLSEIQKQILKKIELDVEYNILQVNYEILDIYKYCKKNNKNIICITDMYLPSTFLTKVLSKNGLYVNKIYVSCEINKSKVEGNIFKYVISDLNIKGNEIIHIGDSKKADKIMPLLNGIKSIRIKNDKYNDLSQVDIFIKNNILKYSNPYQKLGYEKFGKLLYGFSNWLLKELRYKKIDKVYFLSRDGYILKKAFDTINNSNIKSRYLYVSRRSTTIPLLCKYSNFKELNKNIYFPKKITVKKFIECLGLNFDNYVSKFEYLKLDLEKEYITKNLEKEETLKEIYKIIEKDAINNSKKEYDIIMKYLNQEEFKGKIAVVDIGWKGTIQKSLFRLTNNKKIYGFYFGLTKEIRGTNSFGYIFNHTNASYTGLPFLNAAFESCFLAQHGSVEKYMQHDKKIIPMLKKAEFNSQSSKSIIEFQNGALDFVREFINFKYLFCDSSFNYVDRMYEFLVNPTYEEVSYFGELPFYDTFYTTIIDSKSILYYIIHPKKFIYDFRYSVWKIGFLKKVFKINLPYYKFYLLIKSIIKR